MSDPRSTGSILEVETAHVVEPHGIEAERAGHVRCEIRPDVREATAFVERLKSPHAAIEHVIVAAGERGELLDEIRGEVRALGQVARAALDDGHHR